MRIMRAGSSFWKFAKSNMPCLNSIETTIITDRDKGSFEAIDEVLPLAVNFFCSYHRQKNIQTYVKVEVVNTPVCVCTSSY